MQETFVSHNTTYYLKEVPMICRIPAGTGIVLIAKTLQIGNGSKIKLSQRLSTRYYLITFTLLSLSITSCKDFSENPLLDRFGCLTYLCCSKLRRSMNLTADL